MRNFSLFIIVCLVLTSFGFSQSSQKEVVPVALKISRLPQIEFNIVVRDSIAYLPIREVFDHVGFSAEIDSNRLLVRGFIEDPESLFVVDAANKTATNNKRIFGLSDADILVESGGLYFRIDFLNNFFGVEFTYNPRTLTIVTSTSSLGKFPAVKYRSVQLRAQADRERRGFALPESDHFIERNPWTTGAGRLGWNISGRYMNPNIYGSYKFQLGSKVLGGDLDMSLWGNVHPRINRNPILRGTYRIPFPENTIVKQIVIGNQAVSGFFPYNLLGVEVTNRPLSGRSILTWEKFSSQAKPGSNVQVLGGISGSQYSETGSDGLYEMDVPLRYGRSELNFQAFSKFGRSAIDRYYYNIPQNMLPPGEVEYSTFAGKLANVGEQYVSRNSVNVGLSSRFTAGARIDYYGVPGITRGWYGTLSSTGRVLNSLIFSGSVSPNALSQIGFNWLPLSVSEVSVNHIWYSQSNPINFSKAKDRWEVLSNFPLLPSNTLRLGFYGAWTQYAINREMNLNITVAGMFGNIMPQVTARVIRQKTGSLSYTSMHYTDFSLGASLPLQIFFRSEITINHLRNELESFRVDVGKTLFKRLQIHFALQRFPVIPLSSISLSLRYLFPFLDVTSSVTRQNDLQVYNARVIGSMTFDVPEKSFVFGNNLMRRADAGFTIHPFVDDNNNDVRDPNEAALDQGRIYVQNNTLELSPFMMTKNKFSLLRLNPYQMISIYLDPTSLDDPGLVPKYNTIQLYTESYYTKNVDIPIVRGATVRGMVTDGENKPLEGIMINLIPIVAGEQEIRKSIKKTSTFSTGEFEFVFIRPGRYKIEIDQDQIARYGFSARPSRREITLVPKPEGDTAENQNFVLTIK